MILFILIAGTLIWLAVLLSYNGLTWGLVAYAFYYWFIQPLEPMFLPNLTYAQCIGIYLFSIIFRVQHITIIKKQYLDGKKKWVTWAKPWVVLFIGWLFHLIL